MCTPPNTAAARLTDDGSLEVAHAADPLLGVIEERLQLVVIGVL